MPIVVFRNQIGVLKKFIKSFHFIKTKPDPEYLEGSEGCAFTETIRLNLPKGKIRRPLDQPGGWFRAEIVEWPHSFSIAELRVPKTMSQGVALQALHYGWLQGNQ